jgi:hypothetical protein
LDDLWIWNDASASWSQGPSSGRPRTGGAGSYDWGTRRFVVAGGVDAQGAVRTDVATFDGVSWANAGTSDARVIGARAASLTDGVTLLSGGSDGSSLAGDRCLVTRIVCQGKFGKGCHAGTSPYLAPRAVSPSSYTGPRIGTQFDLWINEWGPFAGLGYVALGFERQSCGGRSLPIDLAPFGFDATCTLHMCPASFVAVALSAQLQGSYRMNIPNAQNLLGVAFLAQAFTFGTSSGVQVARSTNALSFVIGF